MKYLYQGVVLGAIAIFIGSFIFITGCSPQGRTPDAETPRIEAGAQYFVVDGVVWLYFIPPGSSMQCVKRRGYTTGTQCVPLPPDAP